MRPLYEADILCDCIKNTLEINQGSFLVNDCRSDVPQVNNSDSDFQLTHQLPDQLVGGESTHKFCNETVVIEFTFDVYIIQSWNNFSLELNSAIFGSKSVVKAQVNQKLMTRNRSSFSFLI